MEDTKTRICNTAIRLFNEKGYENVSLREIAEAAGTTIGNLTYHFAQKELLLESVAQRYQDEFFPKFDENLSSTEKLEKVVESFYRAQHNEEQAPVYYRNVADFAKASPGLAARNEDFRRHLYDYYHAAFLSFKERGVFKDGTTPGQIETLAYTVVFFTAQWIQNSSPYYDEHLPKIPLAEALCNLLKAHIAQTFDEEFMDIWCRQGQKKE